MQRTLAAFMDFAVFRHPNTRRLFVAQLVSQLCDKLMLVGIMWCLAERFPAPWTPGFVGLSALPHLLLAPVAPRAIRRWGGELRTVILTDFARAALLAIFAAALALFPSFELAWLLAAGIGINVFAALFNPSVLSLPPRLAAGQPELLGPTNALIESCFSISAVVAPALATALYAGVGLPGLLLLNAASYAFAGVCEARIDLPATPAPAAPGSAAPDRSGMLRAIAADPRVAGMLLAFLVFNLALGPLIVFLPLYAREVYSGSIGSLASLETALGLGTVGGTIALSLGLAARRLEALDIWKRSCAFLLLISLAYLAFALSRSTGAGTASVAVVGILLAFANVTILSYFQSRPDPAQVTAIMSGVNLISVASLPVSLALVALVLPLAPVRAVAIGCALAAIAVAAGAALLPRALAAPRPAPLGSAPLQPREAR